MFPFFYLVRPNATGDSLRRNNQHPLDLQGVLHIRKGSKSRYRFAETHVHPQGTVRVRLDELNGVPLIREQLLTVKH